MSRIRDRTEDFKDAVRQSAISSGFNEAKLAAIMASFIIHKPRKTTPFTKSALKTLESIEALDQFLSKHRKDYVDRHRTTEQEKDSIEHEVTAFVKACKDQIDILKNCINDDEASSKGWLGIRDTSNADTIAHKHGVVVGSDSADASKPYSLEPRDTNDNQPESLRVKQELLDDETRALQVELSSLLDAAQQTETKMVEMSALNHLMSSHVLQQAQQIEHLYDQLELFHIS
ncbi:Syntaxin-81 [Hibiscus syriacus]|uniref:Syntaxin-81 n=1 Tax=Hibiscus syriacus TaxID=106335 RepID=A0A6A2ZV32_HIBSY|nr:Syntaxin-81 [Hibiscus syriacus]